MSAEDWRQFRVGDVVTRDGSDRHRVIARNDDAGGDVIEVECLKEPDAGWCKVGDRERNSAWRYEYAETINVAAGNQAGRVGSST